MDVVLVGDVCQLFLVLIADVEVLVELRVFASVALPQCLLDGILNFLQYTSCMPNQGT